MSILDDAIREHLELKRQHGAPADELKRLEDEAFGPPARPDQEEDPFAEAPTQFMQVSGDPEGAVSEGPDGAPGEPAGEIGDEDSAAEHRLPNIADLQEAPAPPPPAAEPGETGPGGGHSTEERHAIAEQPTEMFDVESELAASEPPSAPEATGEPHQPAATPPPPGPPAADEAALSDEDLAAAEREEPRLAAPPPQAPSSADPAPPPAQDDFDAEDDFFDEKRLSEELDEALDAPRRRAEPGADAAADADPAGVEADEVVGPSEPAGAAEEHDPVEHPEYESADADHDDVLEDTPDFLEESPEDDQLWFEQKPPKDFDFDD